MSNLGSNVLCVCPFFIRDNGKSIVCEGILPETKMTTDFKTAGEKALFQKCCCFSFEYHKRCRLFASINKKYGGS